MKKFLLCCLTALLLAPVFCQDADLISGMLKTEKATYMDFAYLVATEIGMECTPFEAYAYCDRFGSFRFDADASTPITVETASHFLMNNYGIKGGLMWAALHSPRYAWKELKATGFWKTGIDPDSVLSGRDLIRAFSKFFLTYPDAQLRNPPDQEASNQYLKALLAEEENQI